MSLILLISWLVLMGATGFLGASWTNSMSKGATLAIMAYVAGMLVTFSNIIP